MMFKEMQEVNKNVPREFEGISEVGSIEIRDKNLGGKPYVSTHYIESNYNEKEMAIDSKYCASKLALYAIEFILFTPILYFLAYVTFYFILIVCLASGAAGSCEMYDTWLYVEVAVFSGNSISVVVLIILAACTPKEGLCSNILTAFSLLLRLIVIGSMVGMAIWAASIVSLRGSGCTSGWQYAVASQIVVLAICGAILPVLACGAMAIGLLSEGSWGPPPETH